MQELVHERMIDLTGPDGTMYKRVFVHAEPNGRTTWAGFVEFLSASGGAAVRTGHETTQSNVEGVAYWATGLEPVYFEGALNRALRRSRQAGPEEETAPLPSKGDGAGVVPMRLETVDPAAPLRLMATRTLVPGQARRIKESGALVFERTVRPPSGSKVGIYEFVAQFGSENAAGIMANTLWNDLHGLGARLLIRGDEVALNNAAIKDALLAGQVR
jgi:hypothetical protein